MPKQPNPTLKSRLLDEFNREFIGIMTCDSLGYKAFLAGAKAGLEEAAKEARQEIKNEIGYGVHLRWDEIDIKLRALSKSLGEEV